MGDPSGGWSDDPNRNLNTGSVSTYNAQRGAGEGAEATSTGPRGGGKAGKGSRGNPHWPQASYMSPLTTPRWSSGGPAGASPSCKKAQRRGRGNATEREEETNAGDLWMVRLNLSERMARLVATPYKGLGSEGSGWQARYTFGLLGFLGMTVIYMIRVNLSIAIVAMVGKANTTYVSSNTCPAPNSTEDGVNLEGDFDWDEQTQGLVLSAFFYGYVASNFLGGRATEYLGGRLMFGVGVVGPSLITLLSPFCASVSKELFIIIRVVEGLVQGVTFPSMHFMMSAWIPPKDKAIFGSIILAGMQAGTVLANGVGGLLCNSEFLGGWPSAFYVPGAVGVAWGIPWFLLIHDQPEHHPRISKKELSYILTHRRFVNKEKAVAIPWRSLVTSLPLWSILIMNLGYSFEFYMLLTELPTYFSNMMHFEMSNNGLMSALPYMLQGVLSVVWGFAMSALTARDKVTVNFVRKFSTAFAMYISAGALITMLWVDCNRGLALVVMCLAVGANGAINSGSCLSEQDIAPNLVGTLKGITNSVGAATGILAPLITGAIINNNQTLSAWRIVFIMTSVINIISCTIFIIWATDKVQPWNEPKNKALQIQTEFERRVK